MNYSRIQKSISAALLGLFFFGLVFRVPFSGLTLSTQAGETSLSSLVTVLVNEDIYGEVEDKVQRYARDIQGQLKETRVLIVPTPVNATAFQIASLTERLYYEGYEGVDASVSFASRLIGAVFIGDLPVPVVFDGNKAAKTIVPYTDFEDKVYVYNHESEKYEKNTNNIDGLSSEIWHGVIAPNLGSREENIEAIEGFFDKNHDFYTGQGQFSGERNILNGNKEEEISDIYEPYVFYFDQFREEAGVHYPRYKGYEAYLENREDLVYNRFTKELAEKVSDKVVGEEKQQISQLIADLDPNLDLGVLSEGPDASDSSDIATRYITNNAVKNFLEVINSSTLGEFRSNVHSAGRYNGTGSQVSVDTIPYLIGVLDTISDTVVKGANTDIEEFIDELTIADFAQDIEVGTHITKGGSTGGCGPTKYENFRHGMQVRNIKEAKECSVFRGNSEDGGSLVEANRGLNLDNIQPDLDLCSYGQTQGYWGGSSPLNLDMGGDRSGSTSSASLKLKKYDLDLAIRPVYDIKGAHKNFTQGPLNGEAQTYLDCLEDNYLVSSKYGNVSVQRANENDTSCELVYQIPINGRQPIGWDCGTTNRKADVGIPYEDLLAGKIEPEGCDIINVYLDDNLVYTDQGKEKIMRANEDDCSPSTTSYYFTEIPSYIMHKSPTAEHLGPQIESIIAPNLPVDKERYVDFRWRQSGEYEKLVYPQLFRIDNDVSEFSTLEEKLQNIERNLDSILDAKTSELLNFHSENDRDRVDIKKLLKSKPSKKIFSGIDEKEVSYYDTLVLGIYWNTLTSVSEKYKFVFENYLHDQFEDANTYILPKNKKLYEIAYLGAPGDAQNMYVKLDPEIKDTHPYAETVSQNQELNAHLFSSNVFESNEDDDGLFECAPPEGVPLWEWPGAIVCWLKEMLPPEVAFSTSKCSSETLFLDDDEKAAYYDFGQDAEVCKADENKDGVNDCVMNDLKVATLSLKSSSPRLQYNSSVNLNAKIVNGSGAVLRKASNLAVSFDIITAEVVGSGEGETELIYSKESHSEKSYEALQKYVNFAPRDVATSFGESRYSIGSKNKDVDIYLKAQAKLVDNTGAILLELDSEIITLAVRGDKPFVQMYTAVSGEGVSLSDTVKASTEKNLFLVDTNQYSLDEVSSTVADASLSTEKTIIGISYADKEGIERPLSYPLTVSLLQEGEKVIEDTTVAGGSAYNDLFTLSETGEYELIIVDALGVVISRILQVVPGYASELDIQIGSSIIDVSASSINNVFSIKDSFGNITGGSIYSVVLSLEGSGLLLSSSEGEGLSSKSITTAEGFGAFRLQTTGETGDVQLRAELYDGNLLVDEKNFQITLLDGISANIRYDESALQVGGREATFALQMVDTSGNDIENFDSRAYIQVASQYGEVADEYIEVKNGKAEILFITGKVAGENVPITLHIEGVGKTIVKTVNILPEAAMKMDLVLDRNDLQADPGDSATLTVELKDRYNNTVYGDNSTQVSIELEDGSTKILTSNTSQAVLSGGKAQFDLNATFVPGTAYIKVTTTPDLSFNTFLLGEGDGAVEIKGAGKNSTHITTHYFWNKDPISKQKYNALYSVLLGAEYGDFTQEDYLAGSLLFEPNNKSLAITSLLNAPKEYNDILTLGKGGGVEVVLEDSDLSQDVSSTIGVDAENRLYFDLYNKTLSTLIGRLYYVFGEGVELRSCLFGESRELCNTPRENSSITLQSKQFEMSIVDGENGMILLSEAGRPLVTVGRAGDIELSSMLSLEFDDENAQDYLGLKVMRDGIELASLGLHLVNPEYSFTRDAGTIEGKLGVLSNSILLHVSSYLYGIRDIYSGDGEKSTKAIYYNDPFSTSKRTSRFGGDELFGLENFEDDGNIGWEGGNKTLLSFASGENVGDSLRDYMTFSAVNLGDPVVSLKKIQKSFNDEPDILKSFDAGIGTLLSTDDNIKAYSSFDYDNDGREDILLVKDDGYLKVLENKEHAKEFIDKGNLAYLADKGNHEYVVTGDFSGDGFDDIFLVDKRGDPFALNNIRKDFVRQPLKEVFGLDAKVVQVRSFDMDKDSIDDIITLDDSGNVHIFYGKASNEGALVFDKKLVADGYGINLDGDIRTTGAHIFYEGLYQIQPNEYVDGLIDRLAAEGALDEGKIEELGFNTDRVDSLLFTQIQYSSGAVNETITTEEVIAAIPQLDSEELSQGSLKTYQALQSILEENASDITLHGKNHVGEVTFIKSEYSSIAGVDIEKVFTDKNAGNIQTGDLVDVTVKIQNTSGKTLTNIAYIDTIVSPFEGTSAEITKSHGEIRRAPPGYDILLNNFTLAPGEEAFLRYELRVLPITFGYLKVGLFEKDEVGDDEFGDIILQKSEKNCGENVDIFRSLSPREYLAGVSEPRCDTGKIEIPSNLLQNTIDENNNGVPDYIDEIVSTQEKQQEYAIEIRDEMNEDTDGDGIPDNEDLAPNLDGDNGLGDNISDLHWTQEALEGMDTLIEGLGCGFGGGGCISSPLNWAPLAPGSDPVAFGYPIGDGLKVGEGLPIFSAYTGRQVWGGFFGSPACLPSVWPRNDSTFVPGPLCNPTPGAGGSLGTASPTNFIRLFATPTLTGGAGFAACYGSPASVAGYSNPPGISPIVPGGNCVVIAKPLLSCNNDGSEGDPESLGEADNYGNFGIVNANCGIGTTGNQATSSQNPSVINADFVANYYKTKTGEIEIGEFLGLYSGDQLEELLDGTQLSSPLFSIGESGITVDLDLDGDPNTNFTDVVPISKQRVSAFPSFLMDWITRQAEELITKLTDFPTIFVIMPDMTGLIDDSWEGTLDLWGAGAEKGYKGVIEGYKDGREEGMKESEEKQEIVSELKKEYQALDCDGENKNSLECLKNQADQAKALVESNKATDFGRQEFSGVKTVFEFLGNLPFINIEPKNITVDIPMIDSASIDKTLLNWSLTHKQRIAESEKFTAFFDGKNFSSDCTGITGEELASCIGLNKVSADFLVLIGQLEKNIEALESYHKIPEKLTKLLNQKEIWAAQMLCNTEAIGSLTGQWISDNGKRFKAWVETYLLVKAILKSWQLLIDVFIDYDEECHQCKNERDDLLNFQFRLISMIMPEIPVIILPKWPDIVLDLHNVRLGITVEIPDISFTYRTIVLPSAPGITLPEFSAGLGVNTSLDGFDLPNIGLLDSFEIEELGDIPSLPTVELPDLPPPPTIPKMFASLEKILKIFKLVTKVMCILKSSPFVPEWRAGDQIAFITERGGYLPTDFLDLRLPQISLPFVDAIQVTTYVNLETSTDFLVEMARQVVDPWNKKANNFVSSIGSPVLEDLDLSEYSTSLQVDVEIYSEKGIDVDGDLLNFSTSVVKGVLGVYQYLDEHHEERVDSQEFFSLVHKALSDKVITEERRTDKLQALWAEVSEYGFSQENALIKKLSEANTQKFNAINSILREEIEQTQKMKKELENMYSEEGLQKDLFTQINSDSYRSDFGEYKSRMGEYNTQFKRAAEEFYKPQSADTQSSRLKEDGKNLLAQISGGLSRYQESNGLLSASISGDNSTPVVKNACQVAQDAGQIYNYEGIYVVEEDKSYRLFDYIRELTGEETYSSIDYDLDGDEDMLYLVNSELFLKENLKIQEEGNYIQESPIVLESGKNIFFNGANFIEAVNSFKEINTDTEVVNLAFNAPLRNDVNNFRIEFYTIIDKIFNLGVTDYIPNPTHKHVIDGFRSIDQATVAFESELYTLRSHLSYIDYVGNVPGVVLSTRELIQIDETKDARILSGKQLYTGNIRTTISYSVEGDDTETQSVVTLEPNSSVEFIGTVVIKSINGQLFVEGRGVVELIGAQEISRYAGLPLFDESKFSVAPDFRERFNESSHIDLNYYDGSTYGLNFRELASYVITDLGHNSLDYLVRVDIPNDYYYARVYAFRGLTRGTYSSQKLSSPQVEADTVAPELSFFGDIKVPVYQKKSVDFSDGIYENSTRGGIREVRVDMNLDVDTDGDGDPKNDSETYNVDVTHNRENLEIEFGPFDYPVQKRISIQLIDQNGNIGAHEIDFEVYSPIPDIDSFGDNSIQGSLNEVLINEPVNIYKLRGGKISKLYNRAGEQKVYTIDEGVFNFDTIETSTGLTLKYEGEVIASIDEFTGKIEIMNEASELRVESGDNDYPQITLVGPKGSTIYSQEISLPENREINLVESFETLEEPGMYLNLLETDLFEYYIIPSGASYSAGAAVLYVAGDEEKKPIFTLFPDGRIITGSDRYRLKYVTEGAYITFELVDKVGSKIIGKVLFLIEGSFLMK